MSQEIDVALNDDEVLSYTQRKRKAFLEHLLNEGFPEDTKTQTVLLTALADMDRTALGNKRIQSGERVLQADALVSKAILTISQRYGSQVPFQTSQQGRIPDIDTAKLPSANPVPGETDVGLSTQSYAELVEQFD